jgi:hypothetical protein
MYQGRTAAEAGLVFGHENMGIVIETREGVTLLKKGDRIVLPFNVADGRCRNCEEGRTAFCTGCVCPVLISRGFWKRSRGDVGAVANGDAQGQSGLRRRRLRIRCYGPLPGRASTVPTRPVRGL